MLQNTPVGLLVIVCKCQVNRNLYIAHGVFSGRHRPRLRIWSRFEYLRE
jgi:hypothetical protein